jgi:hypothetical protein
MPAAHPRLASVLLAQRGNGTRLSEDRIFVTENAVIVLDGASQPEAAERDGGWIASQLGADLSEQLRFQPNIDLAHALERSICRVSEAYELRVDSSPSTTVAMVRWDAESLDVLVLCDSPVIVADRQGNVHAIRDDRLAAIARSPGRPKGFRTEHPEIWRALVAAQRSQRNKPGGYWVAEAVPEAARHAVKASFRLDQIGAVLAMTDGVSNGVDRYGIPPNWTEAVTIASDDPARLVEMVHNAEVSDPDGERWPRSKCHDDKSLAAIRFGLIL